APVPHGAPQRTLEDLTIREYRRGDDLHRIHWRSSARHGELMVRHDEPTTTKVLDLLLVLSDQVDDVAEWAVTAAASMAVGLLDAGYGIRVVTVAEGTLRAAPARTAPEALDVLALASAAADLGPDVVRTVQRSTSAGVVAVLDRPDTALADALV